VGTMRRGGTGTRSTPVCSVRRRVSGRTRHGWQDARRRRREERGERADRGPGLRRGRRVPQPDAGDPPAGHAPRDSRNLRHQRCLGRHRHASRRRGGGAGDGSPGRPLSQEARGDRLHRDHGGGLGPVRAVHLAVADAHRARPAGRRDRCDPDRDRDHARGAARRASRAVDQPHELLARGGWGARTTGGRGARAVRLLAVDVLGLGRARPGDHRDDGGPDPGAAGSQARRHPRPGRRIRSGRRPDLAVAGGLQGGGLGLGVRPDPLVVRARRGSVPRLGLVGAAAPVPRGGPAGGRPTTS